ncbi:MAG: hypothetical protein ACK5H1_03515 [Tenacibaculum sp.]
MIVFYIKTKNPPKAILLKTPQIKAVSCTDSVSSLDKAKHKCCYRYLKKGINCKRCPLIYKLKKTS